MTPAVPGGTSVRTLTFQGLGILVFAFLSVDTYGYGPRGHALVGAIADQRMASSASETVSSQLKALLDGLTLEAAATLPDDIKTWDTNPGGFHVTGHPAIEKALRAFVQKNPADGHPSHRDFHFTDVPVVGMEEYASGEVGRSEFDIVHMIRLCVRVLRNEVAEANDRRITKPVAVILLAHYLGDIHQPLHVGAEYFNAAGKPFEPSPAVPGFADQGGNKLTLFTLVGGHETIAGKFHGYWDGQTVTNAFGDAPDHSVAKKLAKTEPANWKLDGPVLTWAEQLANEALPMAREAHDRLVFKAITFHTGDKEIVSGRAEEKVKNHQTFYALWAAATVKAEIHKAGWRLAALLEEALQ